MLQQIWSNCPTKQDNNEKHTRSRKPFSVAIRAKEHSVQLQHTTNV